MFLAHMGPVFFISSSPPKNKRQPEPHVRFFIPILIEILTISLHVLAILITRTMYLLLSMVFINSFFFYLYDELEILGTVVDVVISV